jgi:DNA recombination protein RmuC
LGRCLEKSQQSYDETMNRFSRGKGNLVKRVHDLAKLGAKNKRNLPEALLDAAADDQLDTLADDLPEPEADNGRPVSD